MKEFLGTSLTEKPEIEVIENSASLMKIQKDRNDFNLMLCYSVSSGLPEDPLKKHINSLQTMQKNIFIVREKSDTAEEVKEGIRKWEINTLFPNTPVCVYSNYHSLTPYLAAIPFGVVRLYIRFFFKKGM